MLFLATFVVLAIHDSPESLSVAVHVVLYLDSFHDLKYYFIKVMWLVFYHFHSFAEQAPVLENMVLVPGK